MSTMKFWLSVFCLSTSLAVIVQARHDVVEELYSNRHEEADNWGEWGDWEYCRPGQNAWLVSVKWEPALDLRSDDTSTNGVALYCGRTGSHIEEAHRITSSVGPFGDWEPKRNCGGQYMTGFQVQFQPYQGHGDDTAVNSIRFFCERSNQRLDFITTPWGNWENELHCPHRSVICGIRTQVERVHSSDITGLVRLAVACCPHP